MIKKTKSKTIILILVLLILPYCGFAQFDTDDGTADDFPPAAPIDDYILPMALIGIAGGYYLLSRRREKQEV